MQRFMNYAIQYNYIVEAEQQIAFGIDSSTKGPVLMASLPGYTRLSVHFGSYGNCKRMLNNINKNLVKHSMNKYFPTFENGKVNLDQVYIYRGYNLPRFNITNTGVINRMDFSNSAIYEQQIKETSLEVFSNFMYPNLNDREIFYIAEKAGLGKKHLSDLKSTLSNRNITIQNNKTNIRILYLQKVLSECNTQRKQVQKIIELYNHYVETDESVFEENYSEFISLLENSGINSNIIEQFIQEQKSYETSLDDLLHLVDNGETVRRDILIEKFIDEEELDFLYEQVDEANEPPKLNENYFTILFNNLDLKNKVILLFRTVEAQFANEPQVEPSAIEQYKTKSNIQKARLKELVLEQVIQDENMEELGDVFVELIIDASELIETTNNDSNNINEQTRLVKNLWDNYSSIINSDESEIDVQDKETFKSILDSFWVDTEITENFENLTTATYLQMKQANEIQGFKARNRAENAERQLIDQHSRDT